MSTQGVIRVSGKIIDQNQVMVLFNALPGSDPGRLGHFISIWEGNSIGTSSAALQTENISAGKTSGQLIFTGLTAEKEYMIGYGIPGTEGPDTICATMAVPAGINPGTRLSADLSKVFVSAETIGTDFLIAQLIVPFRYPEKLNNNWVALFHGKFKETMYHGEGAIAMSKNIMPLHQSTIVLKNIPQRLVRFETYTLVQGTGLDAFGNPDYSRLLSYHTFIIWKSRIYIGLSDVIPFMITSAAFLKNNAAI